MLKDEYRLAAIGFDTAENELFKGRARLKPLEISKELDGRFEYRKWLMHCLKSGAKV